MELNCRVIQGSGSLNKDKFFSKKPVMSWTVKDPTYGTGITVLYELKKKFSVGKGFVEIIIPLKDLQMAVKYLSIK